MYISLILWNAIVDKFSERFRSETGLPVEINKGDIHESRDSDTESDSKLHADFNKKNNIDFAQDNNNSSDNKDFLENHEDNQTLTHSSEEEQLEIESTFESLRLHNKISNVKKVSWNFQTTTTTTEKEEEPEEKEVPPSITTMSNKNKISSTKVGNSLKKILIPYIDGRIFAMMKLESGFDRNFVVSHCGMKILLKAKIDSNFVSTKKLLDRYGFNQDNIHMIQV